MEDDDEGLEAAQASEDSTNILDSVIGERRRSSSS